MFQCVCRVAALSLTGLMLLTGCGGETGPQLVSAKGRVTRGGQPLGNVVLQLIPESGPASAAQTNAAGEFTLYGPGGKEGSLPGKFKVTVACPFNPAGGSSASGTAEAATPPCNLPQKYSVPDTTDLTLEIPADGSTSLLIEVPAE